MSIFRRIADVLTGQAAVRAAMPTGIAPPSRASSDAPLTIGEAATLPAVQRALTILTTAAGQLGWIVERGDDRLTGPDVPAIVRKPHLDLTRSEFVAQIVLSMASTGNAYLLREGGETRAETTQLTPLNPHEVHPWRNDAGRIRFDYQGRSYGPDRIEHMRYLAMPGQLKGIGPIQAAQTTMQSARSMREYASHWFETGQPSGILTSDLPLTGDDARKYRNTWNQLDDDGKPISDTENPSRVRVLGKGLHYEPIMISPKDALWIEAQRFDTLEVARIFGVPSSLMLTAIDGNSMTYSNVEQEWLGFVRFGLMAYITPIEEAINLLIPRGQSMRFNLDALLRSDTTTRYAAHRTAIEAGFLTVDEVRAIENLPPLTAAQRAQLTTQPQENPA